MNLRGPTKVSTAEPLSDDIVPLPLDPSVERPRVLVVDDDERNLLAVQNVLDDIGELVVAKSGEEALRHLLKGEFAVILLDVYMPGMDGYETAQLIRSREQTKRIPIVFLSAVNKETEHLMRGYSMGAVDYVFKPVEPIVLRSKVAVFVDLFAKTKEIERKAQQEQALLTEQRSLEMRLLQAQKMDAIGKLTGGIAHDFNNLLAAVIGGLGLIEARAGLVEEHQKILTMTKRAAEQGTDLVRRLLAFARTQNLQPASLCIETLAGAVSDLLSHTLGGLVELEWRSEADAWCVFADRAQLELALMNLIINARDAMPSGGTITVTAENRVQAADGVSLLAPGDYVVLSVIDSGSGIAPAIMEQVMEPFFTTKEVGKGSGLGLSMVYGFAKQSNGAFRLSSEVGQGTTAEIWLPRASDTAEAAVVATKRRRTSDPKNLKILLVDDHEEVRLTTAGMLEDLGHSVTESANGADALAALAKEMCDCHLLISDYAMPKLSGTDFVRGARDLCPELPALIITGYADAAAIGERPNDVVVLSKPFTADQLSAAIAEAVAMCAPAE
jgi:signal transduction histidine kinase